MNTYKNPVSAITKILIVISIILAVNYIALQFYFRIDLTSDNRYTLTDQTKQLIETLDEDVNIKIYLSGDLNPGFKNLSESTRQMLTDLSQLSGRKVTFRFIDPNKGSSTEKTELYAQFKEKNIEPVPVFETSEDGRNTRSLVFPYAIVNYKNKDITVNLLDNIRGYSGTENLNTSIETLEFKFMDALRQLTITQKPKIAFIEGHGELDELDVMDLTSSLNNYYQVDRGQAGLDPSLLDPYKVLIIAKPQTPFSETDKYIIDQYVMKGGRILWMIDAVNVTLDSLTRSDQTIGFYNDLNINDLLFKYGFRVNPVLIEDIQAAMIPINVSPMGKAPKFVPAPWLFNPLLTPNNQSPISRNINVVKGEFVSYIDTVGENTGLKRTTLLSTSQFTKINLTPIPISLSMVNDKPKREEFNKKFLPVAIAAEGEFQSNFTNRMKPMGIIDTRDIPLSKSIKTRQVVIADGDIACNTVRFKQSRPQIIPLGFDEVSNQTYGNKQFIVNTIQYLANDEGWLELRSKSRVLRLLDKEKISSGTTLLKILNLLLPLLLIIIPGILFLIRRKARYGKRY